MFGTPPGDAARTRHAGRPDAVPPNAPWPLQPGQVMLNGVPTTVGDATPAKKGFSRRLFGG